MIKRICCAALLVACLVSVRAPILAEPAADLDPRIVALLGNVSEARMAALLERLQSFGTRHTLSQADSPTRGIGAARQWIFDEMKRSSARLQVTFETYQVARQRRITRDVELRNVVAVLPGHSPRRIYVTGHYDSMARRPVAPGSAAAVSGLPTGSESSSATPSEASGQPDAGADPRLADALAPGLNDDGSGTVLTMELARAFGESGIEFEATLVFVAFAGEEQGLIGALLHAQEAAAEKIPIDAVFNNDIVGNSIGGAGAVDSATVRVFSEEPEDSPSRQLARFIRRYGARYMPSHEVRLIARHDRFGRGGDHTAFNRQGYAAVRFTESKENYSRQHTAEDTVVDVPYLARNARVNAAAVATLALAPPSPRVVDEKLGRPTLSRQPSGYDANITWVASPGAVGYRVYSRHAWTPDWEHELTVGNVTALVLPNVSIDDYVFGVSAIGPGGHESLVSAYVNPPRPEEEVKTVK